MSSKSFNDIEKTVTESNRQAEDAQQAAEEWCTCLKEKAKERKETLLQVLSSLGNHQNAADMVIDAFETYDHFKNKQPTPKGPVLVHP